MVYRSHLSQTMTEIAHLRNRQIAHIGDREDTDNVYVGEGGVDRRGFILVQNWLVGSFTSTQLGGTIWGENILFQS